MEQVISPSHAIESIRHLTEWVNNEDEHAKFILGLNRSSTAVEPLLGAARETLQLPLSVYLVTSEMADVAGSAATALPDDVVVTAADLPSPYGFIVFASHIGDWGQGYPIRAMTWCHLFELDDADDAVAMLLLTGREDVRALETGSEIVENVAQYVSDGGSLRMPNGRPPTPELIEQLMNHSLDRCPEYIPVGVAAVTLGGDALRIHREMHIDDEPDVLLSAMRRMGVHTLVAAWKLMAQPMVVTSTLRDAARLGEVTSESTRGARKRLARAGVDASEPQVIHLRRVYRRDGETDEEHEHRQREWSHRWMVRGHWRNQACGVGRTDRKLIWISGYVKGPNSKELRVRDRVVVWDR